MSELILDKQGNEVEVFVAFNGGFLDLQVRADTKADFEAAAEAENLLVRDDEDNLVPAPGVNIDVLGPVVITAAVLDDEGNVVTPAVLDNRHHVNLRITAPALTNTDADGYENWKLTAIKWTENGEPDTEINAEESALKLANVALIDPATIKSPARVWA